MRRWRRADLQIDSHGSTAFSLLPEEIQRLRTEVADEQDPTYIFTITDILFDIFTLEKAREPFRDATEMMSKLFDAMITLGDFTRASALLQRIHTVLHTDVLQEWQIAAIQAIIDTLGDATHIERIGRAVQQQKPAELGAVKQFLCRLPANAIQPLIEQLLIQSSYRVRGMLCDVLVTPRHRITGSVLAAPRRTAVVPGAQHRLHPRAPGQRTCRVAAH